MASPIELQHYMRRYTLADAEAGIQPFRQTMPDGSVRLFHPPTLRFRCREKAGDAVRWGEWMDVPYFREVEE